MKCHSCGAQLNDRCCFCLCCGTRREAPAPESQIWCGTLCQTVITADPAFVFPAQFAGIHTEEYNRDIRQCAALHQCPVLDLAAFGLSYDALDGTHPNASGMNTLAHMAVRQMTQSPGKCRKRKKSGSHSLPGCSTGSMISPAFE